MSKQTSNMAVAPGAFVRWTLRFKAAQRRSPLRVPEGPLHLLGNYRFGSGALGVDWPLSGIGILLTAFRLRNQREGGRIRNPKRSFTPEVKRALNTKLRY